MKKVKIDEIKRDEDIYPRQQLNHKTIDSYAESLRAGAEFPPIEVQKINIEEDGETKEITVIIDGVHRVEAYKKFNKSLKKEKKETKEELSEVKGKLELKEEEGLKEKKKRLKEKLKKLEGTELIEEIDVNYWKDKVLDKEEHLNELRIEAIKKNLTHGDRLSNKDKKAMCRRMAREDENITITQEEFGEWFNVHQTTIGDWIKDIRAKQRGSRNNLIYKLSLLGWSQKEIGKVTNLHQTTVGNILDNKDNDFLKILNDYRSGKSVKEIAEYTGLDIQTTWAVILKDMDDRERFEELGFSPKIYNVWRFSGCKDLMGEEYPGRIPGRIILNLLYYYTDEGDLVVDPMAGSGTTADACLLMNRKCYCSDINPTRKFIVEHDLKEGLPKMEQIKNGRRRKPDFIFLDPPYWNLKDEFYSEESVSEEELEEWYDFMEGLAEECYEKLKEGGHVALIVEAMVDERGTKEFHDLPYNCMKFFEDVGFKEIHRISVPISTQVKSHHDVEYAKENKIILDINRDLVVYRK